MTAAIIYATREGQARRIAGHAAEWMRRQGAVADLVGAAHIPSSFSLAPYAAAILVASVHLGHHEPEMRAFVKRHLTDLETMPAAFISVSLSEAGAEDETATGEQRAQGAAAASRMIQTFLAETGWRPLRIKAVAGALAYTKYNVPVRFIMKRIARRVGQTTDVSKDHEYTNWIALNEFLDDFLRQLPAGRATNN